MRVCRRVVASLAGRLIATAGAAMVVVVALASLGLTAGTALAEPAVTFDGSPGTASPPATLGPYTTTPYGADPAPLGTLVDGVEDPAGALAFDPSLSHRRIGDGWGTWSHSYTGDVYRTGGARSVTITVPPDTVAFFLYVEPQPFAVVSITATAQEGTSSGAVPVDGFQGARYFGFYGTGGARIERIVVSSPSEFAVGEFGIARGVAPDCSSVAPSVDTLWPPNGKLQAVTLADGSDQQLAVAVSGVVQDEALSMGESAPAVQTGPDSVMLRAARDGDGDGRVYHVAFTATSESGVSCTGQVSVEVPHDLGRRAVDSGPAVDDARAGGG